MSLHIDDAVVELATVDVHHKMRNLVEVFTSEDVCLTLCDQVDSLCGMFIQWSCLVCFPLCNSYSGYSSQIMNELQSDDFLKEVHRLSGVSNAVVNYISCWFRLQKINERLLLS